MVEAGIAKLNVIEKHKYNSLINGNYKIEMVSKPLNLL